MSTMVHRIFQLRSLMLDTGWANRTIALSLYYLVVAIGLLLLYGRGDFSTPGFIYQGF